MKDLVSETNQKQVNILTGKEIVSLVSQDWPVEINIAALTDFKEGVSLLLYHEEETQTVLEDIASTNGMACKDLLVAPRQPGFGYQSIPFAVEAKMVDSIIQRCEALVEKAHDYLLNYQWGKESKENPTSEAGAQDAPAGEMAASMAGFYPANALRADMRVISGLMFGTSILPDQSPNDVNGYLPRLDASEVKISACGRRMFIDEEAVTFKAGKGAVLSAEEILEKGFEISDLTLSDRDQHEAFTNSIVTYVPSIGVFIDAKGVPAPETTIAPVVEAPEPVVIEKTRTSAFNSTVLLWCAVAFSAISLVLSAMPDRPLVRDVSDEHRLPEVDHVISGRTISDEGMENIDLDAIRSSILDQK